MPKRTRWSARRWKRIEACALIAALFTWALEWAVINRTTDLIASVDGWKLGTMQSALEDVNVAYTALNVAGFFQDHQSRAIGDADWRHAWSRPAVRRQYLRYVGKVVALADHAVTEAAAVDSLRSLGLDSATGQLQAKITDTRDHLAADLPLIEQAIPAFSIDSIDSMVDQAGDASRSGYGLLEEVEARLRASRFRAKLIFGAVFILSSFAFIAAKFAEAQREPD